MAENAGMSDIDALESRLAAALDRIRGGVGALAERAEDGARQAALLIEIETRDSRIAELEAQVAAAEEEAKAQAEAQAEAEAQAKAEAQAASEQAQPTADEAEEDGPDPALLVRLGTLEDELAEARAALAARAQDAGPDQAEDAAGADAEQATEQAAALQALEDDLDAHKADLAQTRAANTQLTSQVETLTAKLDAHFTEAAAREDDRRVHLEELDTRMQRLREVNADLRALNGQLRQMVADGLGEPGLLNSAMAAELDALRADRAAEASEINALLAELRPMIEEAS